MTWNSKVAALFTPKRISGRAVFSLSKGLHVVGVGAFELENVVFCFQRKREKRHWKTVSKWMLTCRRATEIALQRTHPLDALETPRSWRTKLFEPSKDILSFSVWWWIWETLPVCVLQFEGTSGSHHYDLSHTEGWGACRCHFLLTKASRLNTTQARCTKVVFQMNTINIEIPRN